MKAGSPSFIECTAEAFLLWACVIALPGCFQEKFDYTIQMEPGSNWIWEAEIDNSLSLPAGPDTMLITSPTTVRLNLHVQDVDASGNYLIVAEYERFSPSILVTIGNRAISTNDLYLPEGDPLEMLRRLVPGNSFQFSLSPKGIVDNVAGLDQLYWQIRSELERARQFRNPQYPAEMLRTIEHALLQDFEGESLVNVLVSTLANLPLEPVGIGDAWPIYLGTPGPDGPPEVSLRLVSRESGIARLEQPDTEFDGDTRDGLRINSFEQSIQLNEATGLPLHFESHATLDRFNSGSASPSSTATIHITAEMFPN